MKEFQKRCDTLFANVKPLPRRNTTVACIYYPGFHPTAFMEAWHGFGWDEWGITYDAKPRFEGHRQPILPQWGPYDESDPIWSAKETDLAADHGIDVWIYDWYWYSGIEIWNEALDRGYLHAENRERMKFGLMWANHTWNDNHPAPAGEPLRELLPIRHSLEDCERVVDQWAERYFSQPNYWRIDGKPWVGIFHYGFMKKELGSDAAVAEALQRVRERARRNGEDDLYLGLFTFTVKEAELGIEAGFDHVTTYNITEGLTQQPQQPIVDYQDMCLNHLALWQAMAEAGLNYCPVVTHGWDVSARNDPKEPWPPVRWDWPWGHLVQNNTPQRFGLLTYAARQYLAASASTKDKFIILNAWNEWTEGSVLLPTVDEGDGVLKAMKAALER